ncbi:hypothetical protein DB41_JE00010, partial [Neochlamydia sp. TUME1]
YNLRNVGYRRNLPYSPFFSPFLSVAYMIFPLKLCKKTSLNQNILESIDKILSNQS